MASDPLVHEPLEVASPRRAPLWTAGVADEHALLADVPVHESIEAMRSAIAPLSLGGGAEREDEDDDEPLELEDDDAEAVDVEPDARLPKPPVRTTEVATVRPRHDSRMVPEVPSTGTAPVTPPPRPRTASVRPPPLSQARTAEVPAVPAQVPRPQSPNRSAPQPYVPSATVAESPVVAPSPAPKAPGDDVADFMSDLISKHREEVRPVDSIRRTGPEWYAEVFDETWLQLAPEHQDRRTAREIRFLLDSLRLGSPRDVLDLCCGAGRHALPLAKLGHRVTGVDLARRLLRKAHKLAEAESIDIRLLQGDMRSIDFVEAFDAVLCMDTSFGFFDDRGNFEVVQAIARSLRPGGRVLLDVVNREHVAARMPRSLWWEKDGIRLMEDVNFRPQTSTLDVVRTVVRPGDTPWEQTMTIRLYAQHELRAMLAMAGLEVLEVSGDVFYRGATFGAEDRRTMVLAQRPT